MIPPFIYLSPYVEPGAISPTVSWPSGEGISSESSIHPSIKLFSQPSILWSVNPSIVLLIVVHLLSPKLHIHIHLPLPLPLLLLLLLLLLLPVVLPLLPFSPFCRVERISREPHIFTHSSTLYVDRFSVVRSTSNRSAAGTLRCQPSTDQPFSMNSWPITEVSLTLAPSVDVRGLQSEESSTLVNCVNQFFSQDFASSWAPPVSDQELRVWPCHSLKFHLSSIRVLTYTDSEEPTQFHKQAANLLDRCNFLRCHVKAQKSHNKLTNKETDKQIGKQRARTNWLVSQSAIELLLLNQSIDTSAHSRRSNLLGAQRRSLRCYFLCGAVIRWSL